jgi:uncharacterized protein (DUF983 family)
VIPRGPRDGVDGPPARRWANPEELNLSRAARLYARGLTLRCPHCGGARLPRTWFRLKTKCPACGLRTDRGEEDFFLGGIMFNYVFCGLFFLGAVIVLMAATWPDVPWGLIQWGGVALIILLPIVFYPLSLTTWLASDILIKPVGEEEMAWHRQSAEGEYRKHRER